MTLDLEGERMPRRPVAALVAVAALALAAGALAAGTTVSINLKAGIGSRTIKACAITHHYTVYRLGTRIAIAGVVRPAPKSFRAKLKLKQCVRGKFVAIWEAGAHEGPAGAYSGAYVARRRGLFFARTYAYIGASRFRSDKRYLQVR
jgi:hypothetical protein